MVKYFMSCFRIFQKSIEHFVFSIMQLLLRIRLVCCARARDHKFTFLRRRRRKKTENYSALKVLKITRSHINGHCIYILKFLTLSWVYSVWQVNILTQMWLCDMLSTENYIKNYLMSLICCDWIKRTMKWIAENIR